MIYISSNSDFINLKTHFDPNTSRYLSAHAYERGPMPASDQFADAPAKSSNPQAIERSTPSTAPTG